MLNFFQRRTQSAPTRAVSLPKFQMAEKKDFVYAVRGGAGHGLHTTWSAALNAGWYQKQAFGNCCKFSSSEMAEAQAFLDYQPFPEGRAGVFAQGMRQQHIFVRLCALAVVTTIFCGIIVKLAYTVHDKLECRGLMISTTPPCIFTHKIISAVTEQQVNIYNLIGAEIVILIGLAFTYFASWL